MRSVGCSWSEALASCGWEFARPDSKRVLAFAYTATVSVQVDESCVSLNPQLSLDTLATVLTTAPEWLGGRSKWLKTEWPRNPAQCLRDLENYALTASKALLAVGAEVPDGTHAEMLNAVAILFPELASALKQSSMSYEAWTAHVTVEANGHMEWGYSGPLVREGLPLPFKDKNLGDRSAFEIFLQNQMRVDIQSKLEGLS